MSVHSNAWLRLLVRLLPARFRAEYGDDLLLALQDWRRDPSRSRMPPQWLAATWFLLRTNLQERFSPTVARRTLAQPGKQASTMDLFLQDARYSVRALAKRPGFTAIALLTLAVGVGANTAIFSVVNAVVLRPLPYPQPDSLVQVRRENTTQPGDLHSTSQVDLEDLARDVESFADLVGYQSTSVTLTGENEPEVLRAQAVTSGLLRVFRAAPAQGRDLVAQDNLPKAPRVAMISDALLQSHLGGDPQAVGKTLFLDGENVEIVGVAPPDFAFRDAVLWIPLYNDTEGCGRGCRLLTGIGRIADGEDPESLASSMEVVSKRLEVDFPGDNTNIRFVATDLKHSLLGQTRSGLFILLGAVGLVLLIAAANLASLQVARGTGRKAEIAVRSALGANRLRLSRLVLLETLLLAVGGGALGVALGTAVTRIVVALAPADVPRLSEASLDLPVLLFGLATSLGVSLLFALWPTWRLVGASSRTGRSTDDRADVRTRNLLMVGEVALSLVLLVAAGLLFKTYDRLLQVDVGFDPAGVHSFFVALPEQPYEDPEKTVAFFESLERELQSLPGIESVGSVLGLPFGRNRLSTSVEFVGEPPVPPEHERNTVIRVVTSGYLDTLGISGVAGRGLEPTDRRDGQGVAVVNQEFVDRYLDGQDVIGKEIELSIALGYDDEPPRIIVGVVENNLSAIPQEETQPETFVPQAQMAAPWLSVAMRAKGPLSWTAVTEAVRRVDPNIPLRRKVAMTEAIDEDRGPARFYLVLLGTFAAIAVFLAAIGLYGVISYLVSRRTREIAIRLAVGANSADVVGHFVGQGLKLVAIGVGVGVGISLLGSRLLASLLYEVDPFDPSTYVLVCLAMVLVAMTAVLGPAMRAGRVAPARALKEE